jgi:hypothetical protein
LPRVDDGALGGDESRLAFRVADLLAGDEGILSAMVNGRVPASNISNMLPRNKVIEIRGYYRSRKTRGTSRRVATTIAFFYTVSTTTMYARVRLLQSPT